MKPRCFVALAVTASRLTAALLVVLAVALGSSGCATRAPAPAEMPTTPSSTEARASGTPAEDAALGHTADATVVAQATERAARDRPVPQWTFGSPGIEPGELMLPVDVDLDGEGNIYVSDSKGVQRFSPDGTFLNLIGASVLKVAAGIAVADDGKVLVTGMGPSVYVFQPTGELKATIGEEGDGPGQLRRPVDVALDAAGDIYVVDAQKRQIERYAPDGQHRQTIGGGEAGPKFESPRVLTIDPAGHLFVGMGDDYLIQLVTSDGLRLDTFGKSYAGESMWRTGGLALDGKGRLYASRTVGHAIQAFSVVDTPKWLWDYGELGGELGQFNAPGGLACYDGTLYVADTSNNRIQVLRLP